MTRDQAFQLGTILVAWSRGSFVKVKTTLQDEWYEFDPGSLRAINVDEGIEWEIAPPPRMKELFRPLLVSPDEAEPRVVEPRDGIRFKLKELYELLGCDGLLVLSLRKNWIMISDESGKLSNKPVNPEATAWAISAEAMAPDDVIVGHALVCQRKHFE